MLQASLMLEPDSYEAHYNLGLTYDRWAVTCSGSAWSRPANALLWPANKGKTPPSWSGLAGQTEEWRRPGGRGDPVSVTWEGLTMSEGMSALFGGGRERGPSGHDPRVHRKQARPPPPSVWRCGGVGGQKVMILQFLKAKGYSEVTDRASAAASRWRHDGQVLFYRSGRPDERGG